MLAGNAMAHERPSLNGYEGKGDPRDRVTCNATVSSGLAQPALLHRLRAEASILTLLISCPNIYAGTQDGDIILWSLDTYEQVSKFRAHRGSVLCLCVSYDGKFLFSGGGDALVNVWSTTDLQRLYSVYSSYDVGDVFCVAYSSALHTIYLGAQNTSIQWCDLSKSDLRPAPNPTSHPSYRNHRFFDSKGPGGISTPRPQSAEDNRAIGGQELQIEVDHIVQYAHYGYVYCMTLAHNLSTPHHHGETLISGGGDGSIKLWSLDPSAEGAVNELAVLENGDASVLTIAMYESLLYSGKLEGRMDVWDPETCQLIRSLRVCSEDVITLSIGHDLVFTGSSKGNVKIFNQHHSNVSEWRAHNQLILASAVMTVSHRELYVTGGNDGCIAIWDLSNCFDRPKKASIMDNEELVLDLAKFVSFQTISSKLQYERDCRRGASFLRGLFRRFGAETELLSTGEERNPIVFARFSTKDALRLRRKTVVFYGHYDVVSADTKTRAWVSDPFLLRRESGYLYGRGTSDNKGPILAALYAVADVIQAGSLDLDIVFLVEGEEESGSRGFRAAIRQYRELIGEVDWILVANSYWLTDDIPCLTYGLRGVVRAKISIKSERPDLHSGVDGSHLLHEPMKDLVAVLARLTDENGKISIPGFYDVLRPITKEGDARYESIVKYLLQQNPKLGDPDVLKASFKARWREPSLTIHRIHQSGVASSSLIPHASQADISIRLVPDQTSEAIINAFKEHVCKCFAELISSNAVNIAIEHRAEPWLGDPRNHLFKVLEAAVTETWAPLLEQHQSLALSPLAVKTNNVPPAKPINSPKSSPLTTTILSTTRSPTSPTINGHTKTSSLGQGASARQRQKPLYIREGGSIPAIRFLEQELNAPAAHLPCGQASDSAHLDNERLRVTNLYNSRKIFQKVFMNITKDVT